MIITLDKVSHDQSLYPKSWSKKFCKEQKVKEVFQKHFVALLINYEKRLSDHKQDLEVLKTGFYYGLDYMSCLAEHESKKMI